MKLKFFLNKKIISYKDLFPVQHPVNIFVGITFL
jgi:hypothetical protein